MSGETFTPRQDVPPGSNGREERSGPNLSPEDLALIQTLVIEDDKPVENMFVEKEYRLLTEPLYTSWTPPSGSFLATSNVGLFYALREPPLVPDMMLSLGVPANRDLKRKENNSYFVAVIGKLPEVVVEIVSDSYGGEETHKKDTYARIGVLYYIICDPDNRLKGGTLRAFQLRGKNYRSIDPSWLPKVGLGLRFWDGAFEGRQDHWLRWCDRDGTPILTGHELAEQEKQRTTQEKRRTKREKQRTEQEKQRAEQEKQRAERLAAQLRALGVEPDV